MTEIQTVAVKGHLCEGLERLEEASTYGCIPEIDNYHLTACDGTNPIPILFCPFCGVELPPHDAENCYDCRYGRADED